MKQIWNQMGSLTRLEELAEGNTVLHRLHPGVKLLGTLLYLTGLLSLGPYDLVRLAPFLSYPLIATVLSEVPFKLLLRRTLIALPFSLFAGVGNLIFDRNVVYSLGRLPITGGMLSCGSIFLRTLLVVWAVLLLMAVTPLGELTAQLRRMHVPKVLVNLLEMTYRYVGTLMEEAGRMFTAYALRAPGKKALEMRHMGTFVGSLLLKSSHRAQRVYAAMLLRGYGAGREEAARRSLRPADFWYLLLVGGGALCFRMIDIPTLLGRWMLC